MPDRFLTLVLAFLAGCSNSSLENSVKQRFADPASAQIRHVTYSDLRNYACVEVYAKDQHGAFRRTEAYYQNLKGAWKHVYDYPETHSECVELINVIDRPPARKGGRIS